MIAVNKMNPANKMNQTIPSNQSSLLHGKKLWLWLGPTIGVVVVAMLVIFIGGWGWPGWFKSSYDAFSCSNCNELGKCKTCCVKDINGALSCLSIPGLDKKDPNLQSTKIAIDNACAKVNKIKSNDVKFCSSKPKAPNINCWGVSKPCCLTTTGGQKMCHDHITKEQCGTISYSYAKDAPESCKENKPMAPGSPGAKPSPPSCRKYIITNNNSGIWCE